MQPRNELLAAEDVKQQVLVALLYDVFFSHTVSLANGVGKSVR